MDFTTFRNEMQSNFASMLLLDNLFFVTVDRDSLWDTWISSFPQEQRQEHNCNACRSFVKNYGAIVSIKPDYSLWSIWDFHTSNKHWQVVVDSMCDLVYCTTVRDTFIAESKDLGFASNTQSIKDPETQKIIDVHTWQHLHLTVPAKYKLGRGVTSVGAALGAARDPRNVLGRALQEFSTQDVEIVLDLIAQGSLYRGEEFKSALESLLQLQQEYQTLTDLQKPNFTWVKAPQVGYVAKIRNHAIGTLLIDISRDVDLMVALRKYDSIMAPSNYKRTTTEATLKQKKEAEAFVTEQGYMPSLARRYARMDDITADKLLWSNRDSSVVSDSPFAALLKESPVNPKSFAHVEEITLDNFIANVLPRASTLEVFLENKHANNLMSLITAVNKDAPALAPWGHETWYYKGDVTDALKQTVEKRGGSVVGELRFSIEWNNKGDNNVDLDAHSTLAGEHIYFSSFKKPSVSPFSGQLDIDITQPNNPVQVPKGEPAVENIAYQNLLSVPDNSPFEFSVYNFASSTSNGGFRAQIEYKGEIYNYSYDKNLRGNQSIVVAKGVLSKTSGLQFTQSLEASTTTASREVWGLHTNTWQKVTTAMLSPNFWDDFTIGNKHFFMFVAEAKNDDPLVRGFYNEFLIPALQPHRKTFETLGRYVTVPPSDQQLSGIGFSSTVRADFLVRVTGASQRVLRVKV